MVGVRKVGFRLGLLIPVLISISFVFSFSSCTFDFVVGPKSTEFSVDVHHAGFFCGIGINQTYVDGQVSWFDHCDGESWSFFWIEEMIAMLGYDVSSPKLRIYWLLLGKSVADGLRIVSSDEETIVMRQITHKVKNFVLYLDHQDQVAKTYDDIVLDPIAVQPKVLNPKKGDLCREGGKVAIILQQP